MPQKYVILMMPRDRAYKNVPFEDVPPPLPPVLFEIFPKNCQKSWIFSYIFFTIFSLTSFLTVILDSMLYQKKGPIIMP